MKELELSIFQNWKELICELHEKNFDDIESFCSERRRRLNYSFFDLSDFSFDQIRKSSCRNVFLALEKALEAEEASVKALSSGLDLYKGNSDDKYVSYYRVDVEPMSHKSVVERMVDYAFRHKELIKKNKEEKTFSICKKYFFITSVLQNLKTLSLGFLRNSPLIKSPYITIIKLEKFTHEKDRQV